MKKLIYLIVVIGVLALIVAGCGLLTVPPSDKAKPDSDCTTIQSGELIDSAGNVITTGYDMWGYNYQAHMFEGLYCNAGRPNPVCENDDTYLIMKWNDAWLSNKSCDGDGLLDRHFGYDTYRDSGAWLTNHQWGSYDEDIIVDEVNIGLESSEVGHNLEGWSNLWTWGGGYGGGDDGTLRLLMGPGDGCGPGFEDAYFTMNTNGAEAHKLILRHLDGSQNDNFDIYILNVNGIDWELIGSYASQGGAEEWVTSDFAFSPRSGELKFKLVATGTVTIWCDTWGQVAFSWAQLEGTCYWDYFVKIVAAPADATLTGGIWYNADGTEIGPVIWGEFATIQEVYNDPCAGYEGILYKSPAGPGLGNW